MYCKEESSINSENDKTEHPSNYSQHYKNSGKTAELSMQQRRNLFLNEHKEKHNQMFDEHRDLSDLFEEIEDQTESNNEEPMEIDKKVRNKKITFKMTMSEWLLDTPEDIHEKWLIKFCPEGKRRLIVADKKITKSFNKFGYLTSQFVSNLPGGRKIKNYNQKSGLTVLDCVYNKFTKTFFVLDMLVWNSTSFIDCEAELRHCWIRSKYTECPECFLPYEKDSFKFNVLHDYAADLSTMESKMFEYSSNYQIPCDGILFYHKEAPYIQGDTPLVNWLKPFMLVEKFNINIPQEYEAKRPTNYVDLTSYLIKCSRKCQKRIVGAEKDKNCIVKMEV